MRNMWKSVVFLIALSSLEAKNEFGALAIGKTVGKAWIVGECTDQASRAAAVKCAEKKFKKNGGVMVTQIRDWQCKGWMAASVSPGGGFGIAWCRPTEEQARADATNACVAGSRSGVCGPIFTKDDTN